jgi:hypothetical protein
MWPVKIKPGDKLRINAKYGPYFRKSYLSRVGDILSQKLLFAYTPIYEGNYVRLPKGENV